MNDPLIRAEQIGRVFGVGDTSSVALAEATFCVHAKDLIALTGPSGSGKSTLLHLIGGLDTPTSGSLAWPGLGSLETLRPSLVANIFQGPSLIAPITVLDNVALPMLLAGFPRDETMERAMVELGRLEIADLAQKLPEAISGGQAQRAAIARALAIRPRLILADEPTGQLDSTTALQVLDVLVSSVRDSGAALILSTHDARIAGRLPTAWRIRAGKLDVPASVCAATGSEIS